MLENYYLLLHLLNYYSLLNVILQYEQKCFFQSTYHIIIIACAPLSKLFWLFINIILFLIVKYIWLHIIISTGANKILLFKYYDYDNAHTNNFTGWNKIYW